MFIKSGYGISQAKRYYFTKHIRTDDCLNPDCAKLVVRAATWTTKSVAVAHVNQNARTPVASTENMEDTPVQNPQSCLLGPGVQWVRVGLDHNIVAAASTDATVPWQL